jgi:hypothetical protein
MQNNGILNYATFAEVSFTTETLNSRKDDHWKDRVNALFQYFT